MAFAPAQADDGPMAGMNLTPLVDVMLVLLVIFMVTAPLLEHRLGLRLPQSPPTAERPPEPRQLQVQPGDVFRLDGQALSPVRLEQVLADARREDPDLVLRVEVSPDADYQSAATAFALARRAGIDNLALPAD